LPALNAPGLPAAPSLPKMGPAEIVGERRAVPMDLSATITTITSPLWADRNLRSGTIDHIGNATEMMPGADRNIPGLTALISTSFLINLQSEH